MEQLTFDAPLRALARRRDPETSQEAAGRVDAKGVALAVLTELARGPGTCHELAERLGASLVSISPRMKPLEALGRVERVGRREGRTVWKLKGEADAQ